jgi:elongation factor P
MNIKANDIRKGYVIKFRDRVVRVLSATHHTPGNLRAMVQADMKDVKTGANVNHRFRSDDTVEKLNVDFMNMEYLYAEGDSFVFMNSENYEQVFLNKEMIGEYAGFLLPNMKIVVSFIEGLQCRHLLLESCRVHQIALSQKNILILFSQLLIVFR